VILGTQPPEGTDLEVVRLLPLQLVAVAAPKVAAEMAGKPGARAFDNQTLIMHRSFRSNAWDDWFKQFRLDLRRLKSVVEFDNMTAVARATERGGGIALMPALVCEPWFERGALVRIEGFEYPANDAYFLVARRDDIARSELRALTDWMIEQFRFAG
jgi:LysR family glycine cleavage system transcriptional activator